MVILVLIVVSILKLVSCFLIHKSAYLKIDYLHSASYSPRTLEQALLDLDALLDLA